MTSRSPYLAEFTRKVGEFYNCVQNYYKIADEKKLNADLAKPDIDLVCFFELNELKKHVRQNPWGLHYHDLIKLQPQEENEFVEILAKAHDH